MAGNVRINRQRQKPSIQDEIAHLRGLDLMGLRVRWQGIFKGQAPSHFPRHLLFGVLAYRLQAAVRCAIYTRVSTDSGLDQDFNSLDAQYDAAQAYVRSQAHAHWTVIKSRYDDGGFSGGSTDRPALQQLLADVKAHKVNVIVVY